MRSIKAMALIMSCILLMGLCCCRNYNREFKEGLAGSDPVPGKPVLYGQEITLPCTIGDMKDKGFDTDGRIVTEFVNMWCQDNKESACLCYLSGEYTKDGMDTAGDDAVILGIQIFRGDGPIEFELNGTPPGSSEQDVIAQWGEPQAEYSGNHERFIFYKGENGIVYKCTESSAGDVFAFVFGTYDFMTARGKAV